MEWDSVCSTSMQRARHSASLLRGLLLLAVLLIGAGRTGAAEPPRGDRFLVKPAEGANPVGIVRFHTDRGARVESRFAAFGGIEVVRIPANRLVDEVMAEYRRSGLFAWVEPDFGLSAARVPDDPYFGDGSLWALENTGRFGGHEDADIDAPEAWDVRTDAGGIIVAVVDSGVRYTHEDLADSMWRNPGEIPDNGRDDDGNRIADDVFGIDALANSGDPIDQNGHGTHVAGIIGAQGNNGKGITGVAWNVRIMALRFMDAQGNGSVSDAIQCLDYARTHGARIINASWGGPDFSLAMRSAIESLGDEGILLVAAAGNDANDNDAKPFYPAGFALDNIVAVAATTRTDDLADYSNFGRESVDLAAPGSSIYSCWYQSDASYAYSSGTSMAAPHVSGALALMAARFPEKGRLELVDDLLAHVDTKAELADFCASGGRLNLANAMGPRFQAAFSASARTGTVPFEVRFHDESIGTIVERTWDFGDGTPTVSEVDPTHVYSREGSFVVTLEVRDELGNTASAQTTVEVLANYRMESTEFSWLEPAEAQTLVLSDDGVSTAIALPFPVRFYGRDQDAIYVGANGLMGFQPDGLSSPVNTSLPDSAAPNQILCPYWDDLNPDRNGVITYGVVGTSPDRQWVASWKNVAHGARGRPVFLSFQAVLSESNHTIEFHYLDVAEDSNVGAGRGATIGLEDASGAVAAMYSQDGSRSIQSGEAVLFRPAATTRMTVNGVGEIAFHGTVGGAYLPDLYSWTVENSGEAALTWSAATSEPWLGIDPASGTLAPGQSEPIALALTEGALDLPAGTHTVNVSVVNEQNGFGNVEVSGTLSVDGEMGILTVTPESGFSVVAVEGEPDSLASKVFTLANTGDASIGWEVTHAEDWISLSAASGSLGVGESTTVTVRLNENAVTLPAGSYEDTLQFFNLATGEGDTTRLVHLQLDPLPASVLSLTPAEDLRITRYGDGSFSSTAKEYILSNQGQISVEWYMASEASWLAVSPSGGVLDAGRSTAIQVALLPSAAQLSPGSYTDSLHWGPADGSSDQQFAAILDIHLPVTLRLSRTENAELRIQIIGEPGENYLLEFSHDLLHWETRAAISIAPDGTAEILEPADPQVVTEYFRLSLQAGI